MILQEAKIKENIKTDKKIRVCFVCTGNTCRSPMAAAALNHYAGDRFIATSAGISACAGCDMTPGAQRALEAHGIEVPPHISRPFTENTARDNDIIIAMTGRHFMSLMQSYPAYTAKFECMKREISDPYGGDDAVYSACFDEIVVCLKERFSF